MQISITMSRNRFKDARNKREPGSFIPLPHRAIRSESCAKLTPYQAKLLLELVAQYRGNNNGDLCATWSLMRKRGFSSKDTLNKAIKGLLERDWIEISRRGGRNRAQLYALTFYAVDHCNGKLDIAATHTPKSLWRRHEPIATLQPRAASLYRHAG